MVLHKDGYEPAYYIPKADIRMHLLQPSGHATRCPHKGTARYYWSIKAGERVIDNVAWTYDAPFDAAADIAKLVAFYPDRVDTKEATGL